MSSDQIHSRQDRHLRHIKYRLDTDFMSEPVREVPEQVVKMTSLKRKRDPDISDDSAVESDAGSSDHEWSDDRLDGKSTRRGSKAARMSIEDETACYAMDDVCQSPKERMLMRQWLHLQADRKAIAGLHWFNHSRTQLRIPWKHGSRTGWTLEDCILYQAWAEHTGKYNRLVNEPKRWKANFRCALNSLPDVREIKNLCQKRGSDPFKVYEFLPEQPRKSQTKKTKKPGKKFRSGPSQCDRPIEFADCQPKVEAIDEDILSFEAERCDARDHSYQRLPQVQTEPSYIQPQRYQPVIPITVEEISEEELCELTFAPQKFTSLRPVKPDYSSLSPSSHSDFSESTEWDSFIEESFTEDNMPVFENVLVDDNINPWILDPSCLTGFNDIDEC